VGYGLSVVPQNRQENEDGVGHVSRSITLLHLEASRARVSQSSHKTGGGATRMMRMISLWRSRGDKAEYEWVNATDCIRLFYPSFAIFVVFDHKGSLVFLLAYK
jgi:hypothetical protein